MSNDKNKQLNESEKQVIYILEKNEEKDEIPIGDKEEEIEREYIKERKDYAGTKNYPSFSRSSDKLGNLPYSPTTNFRRTKSDVENNANHDYRSQFKGILFLIVIIFK